MGFLRRLFGGDATDRRERDEPAEEPEAEDAPRAEDAPAEGRAATGDDEQARDRELLRADAERLGDPLLQRQLRYADRSWTPPAQGGDRRADDEETTEP